MSFDFPNAQLPAPTPLAYSYAENDIEADFKQLFIDLFSAMLAVDVFDANVLGAAHLGSFDLVRQSVNVDGLSVLQGDREEPSTRYLYRAWKSGDMQGRGLHFLRTYLQLLFPNQCVIYQMWHENYEGRTYPEWLHRLQPQYSMHDVLLGEEGFYLDVDDPWYLDSHYYHLDESMAPDEYSTFELFLTSRIAIEFGDGVEPKTIQDLAQIFMTCIPARFVPTFQFWRDNVLSEPDDIDRWNLGDRYLEPRVLISLTEWISS